MRTTPSQQEDNALRNGLSVLEPTSFPDLEQALQLFEKDYAPPLSVSARPSPPRWRSLWLWSPLLMGTACVALFFLLPAATTQHALMAKGVALEFWYTGPQVNYRTQQQARNGEVLVPGTQFHLKMRSQHNEHGMLVLVNQKGKVTALAPLAGKQSLPVTALQQTFQPLEMDDYLGKERLFALFSKNPFTLKDVENTFAKAFRQAQKQLLRMSPQSNRWRVVWSLWYEKQALRKKP